MYEYEEDGVRKQVSPAVSVCGLPRSTFSLVAVYARGLDSFLYVAIFTRHALCKRRVRS